MKFVCYIGNNRVGKTTMANSLHKMIRRDGRRTSGLLSFGDALRHELIDLYGIPFEIVFDASIDKNNFAITLGDYKFQYKTAQLWVKHSLIRDVSHFADVEISLRELFMTHATRIRRAEDQYYWTNRFNDSVHQAELDKCDIVIVDDARDATDFEYFGDEDVTIYHLTNGAEVPVDLQQDRVSEWISNNPDKIESTISLPIPVSGNVADKINADHIIKKIIPPPTPQSFQW